MNAFLQFLLENIGNIIVVIVVVTLGIIMFRKDKKTLYKILLVLVTEAEKKVKGDKAGRDRFIMVCNKVYVWLPSIIRMFLSEQALVDLIEKALVEAKLYWEKYPELLETKSEDEDILKVIK